MYPTKLIAAALCFAVSLSAMISRPHTTVRYHLAQFWTPGAGQSAGSGDSIARRLVIRARTASWDFAFNCSEGRCRFEGSRHPRDRGDTGDVTIAAFFSGDRS